MNAQFQTPADLFRVDSDGVRLQASTSSISDYLTFPAEPGQERVDLSPEGVLFTWTSQEFPLRHRRRSRPAESSHHSVSGTWSSRRAYWWKVGSRRVIQSV